MEECEKIAEWVHGLPEHDGIPLTHIIFRRGFAASDWIVGSLFVAAVEAQLLRVRRHKFLPTDLIVSIYEYMATERFLTKDSLAPILSRTNYAGFILSTGSCGTTLILCLCWHANPQPISQHNMADGAYLPQWGQLPVEQYLIRFWDYSSAETAGDQRLRLIHQFLDLDEIPAEWDPTLHAGEWYEVPPRIPTEEQIDIILRPWRSDNIRKMAWKIWGNDNNRAILLRTHYNPQNNEKVAELLGSDEFDEDEAWWALLNDPELFSFGDQWWLVFDILPELAGPSQGYTRVPCPEIVTQERRYLKDALPCLNLSDKWRVDSSRNACIERKTAYFRRSLSETYLTIADREAFRTNMIRLVYLDTKRNIVQETRMDFNEQTFTDITVEWDQLAMPSALWEIGTVGEKYRANRELGRKFYQLNEADLES